ncbi:phosphotransferase [Candidatus Pacearchaeota archaeon]|nr:phosphotransferase [Candidatus Pacearchaeota archaeon]
MKLTPSFVKRIENLYDIGKVISYKPFESGIVNHNFDTKTTKGNYVLRFLGNQLDSYKQFQSDLEFEVLNHLKEKGYPYAIPVPLVDNKGRQLSRVYNKPFWVYEKISGTASHKGNPVRVRELASALAHYHNAVRDFKFDRNHRYAYSLDWAKRNHASIRLGAVKNDADKLLVENYERIGKILKRLDSVDFRKGLTITHSDFGYHNVLFKGDKIVGVLDFDGVQIAPLANDLAKSVSYSCMGEGVLNRRAYNNFLAQYRKIANLPKTQEKLIFPLILGNAAANFLWHYNTMKKATDKREYFMGHQLKRINAMSKELGWSIK